MPAPFGGGETTAIGSNSSDGSDHSNDDHTPRDYTNSRPFPNPSLTSLCPPITLKFIDVTYRIKIESRVSKSSPITQCVTGHVEHPQPSDDITERTILNGITGMASPGEILAVLGPSGSGKSTLLNALAGRLHGRGCTGAILANNKPCSARRLGRAVQRQTGFVAQDDVLFPHLTVRETLLFCALLRLPASLSRAEKAAAAEAVMADLGLERCGDTVVGNAFVRGVSGGERRRVSIAHELLVNPTMLILDEPTSGLDSTAAHRLVAALGGLAARRGKTVIASVHQPSSRVYQMFDAVLVLSEGRCIYFGRGRDAMNYFHSIGFSPSFPMNPADFLLDLANGVFQHDHGQSERENNNNNNNNNNNMLINIKPTLVSSYNTLLAPKVKSLCMESTCKEQQQQALESMSQCNSSKLDQTHKRISRRSSSCCCYNSSSKISLSTWFIHFTILLQRSLKERRHEAFQTLRVFQVITAAVLSGLMWWHSDYLNVQDRLGLLFFVAIFWGVLPSFNSVFAFPQERAILIKEQASGMYTISSYFMARVVGDMPMELVLPTVFLVVAYWMAGLKPELGAFLLTLIVLLFYVLVSQGLGLALGAAIMDAKQASTLATVTMLAFVLTGGFYVHKVPYCLAWIKYVSTTFYTYRLLISVQYGDGKAISELLGCSDIHHRNRHHGSDDLYKANCKFIEEDVAGQISPLLSVGVMLFMFFGYRFLAYLALRRIKP